MERAIEIPPAFGDFSRPYRYRIWYGGRGSSKSWTVARVLVAMAASRNLRILCVREHQNATHDSVQRLLEDQITALGLTAWFKVWRDWITSRSGAKFLFKGLARNIQGIKSTEGIDICWVEEGQSISQASLDILIPTVRKTGSEIWVTYNPNRPEDPVHILAQRLRGDDDALVRQVNWRDNPWFPDTLEGERQRLLKHDPQLYEHVREGACRQQSAAIIFHDRVIFEAFETPSDARFYFGADWGFAQDPTVLIRCFVQDDCVYVDYEAYGVKTEIDALPALFLRIPGAESWPILADSARPETISYMARTGGLRIRGVEKWPGSLEDGIARLKAFRQIIVHPRCPQIGQEFRRYSYLTDPHTGDILPKIEDRWNYGIDALRYALSPLIRHRRQMPHFGAYLKSPRQSE